MAMGIRRQARIAALQTLYEYDSAHHDPDAVLDRLAADDHLPSKAVEFARTLVHGVLEHLEEIDTAIQFAAPEWPLAQMARIDKNVLRLAIFEILYNNAVPAKVAINEAVELAKLFGSDTSSRFVNGVLGTVYSRSRGSKTSSAGSEVK